MRYVISEAKVDLIPLTREIEQIENYIELQKLRYSEEDDVSINFRVEGEINDFKITPMLLIPFVENAFKHSFDLKNPMLIDIELRTMNSKLDFTVKNSKSKHTVDKKFNPSGIGLSNVKRRLDLLYPDSYILEISEEGEFYIINLEIT